MPTLREMLKFICAASEAQGIPFGDQCAKQMEMEIRKAWPAERVYIPPANSRKDSARAEDIRKAAERLPSTVVAARYGVHRSTVYRQLKK